MQRPSVTVILPHYDCARFLRDAVLSILAQRDVSVQLWLVDDCSPTDDWRRSIADLADDDRLRVYRTSQNVGLYRLKNAVIPLITTPYVAFQDADDLSEPTRLAKQIALMERTRAGLVGCGFRYLTEDSAIVSERTMVRNGNLWLWLWLGRFVLLHPTSVCRRDIFGAIGGFDGTARFAADDDFLFRVAALYRVRNVDEVLYSYRQRTESLTGRPDTGHGSPARLAYVRNARRRAARRRWIFGRRRLMHALQAPPNDIAFTVDRVRMGAPARPAAQGSPVDLGGPADRGARDRETRPHAGERTDHPDGLEGQS